MKSANTDVTLIKPIDSIIDSEYGRITYQEWCERELKRINNPKMIIRYGEQKTTSGNKYVTTRKVCCIGR